MKVIAVAGGSGSGKSLFASYLSQKLGKAVILSLDDFYLDKPKDISPDLYNFDEPAAFDFKFFHKVIEDLLSGLPIQMPLYDYSSCRRIKNIKVFPEEYLIIEGLYVLMHSSIRSLLTYSFFLESPPDVLLSRRIIRDSVERNLEVRSIIQRYFKFVRPYYYSHVIITKKHAHMIVENDHNSMLDLFIEEFFKKYRL